MAETGFGRDRELIRIIKSLVKKGPFAVEFKDGHKSIPICHGAPAARPGVEIVTHEAASVGNQRSSGNVLGCDDAICDLLGVERFPIEEEFRVELSRPPSGEHLAHERIVD